MQRFLVVIVLAAVAAVAAPPSSIIPRSNGASILNKEAAGDSQWARDLAPLPASVQKAAPKKQAVKLSIERNGFDEAEITEPRLGIDVDVRRDGADYALSGYLKAHGWELEPPRSLRGVALMGGGINVEVRPFGDLGYSLSGPYKKEDGSDGTLSLRVDADGLPVRDLSIRDAGIDLEARWSARGYTISGSVDPQRYGKRELAIIGGALATLTDDLFR